MKQFLVVFVVLVAACSSEESSADKNSPSDSTSEVSSPDTAPVDGEDTGERDETAAPEDGTDAELTSNDTGGASCSELGATECFSNSDCSAGKRCEVVDSSEGDVSCCMEGERGQNEAGETCGRSINCQSGVCISRFEEKRCSTTCETEMDCPESMKNCRDLPGTSDKWCLPTPEIASCAEIDSNSCFANTDCSSGQRCQDLGGSESVPCCIRGERGDKEAGETCEEGRGQFQCATGVCISGNGQNLCSDTCEDKSDCPEGMKNCTPIPNASAERWCLPDQ